MNNSISSLRDRTQRLTACVRSAVPRSLLCVVALGVLQGCKLLTYTTVAAVGVVGLVGYGVYKTGEAAVTGVGSAVSGVAGGVSSATTAVFSEGDFKATCPGNVEDVWRASDSVLKANGLRIVSGDRDALSGRIGASTWDNQPVTILLDSAGQGRTNVRVRIGTGGDLKKSETLYNMIADTLVQKQNASRGGV